MFNNYRLISPSNGVSCAKAFGRPDTSGASPMRALTADPAVAHVSLVALARWRAQQQPDQRAYTFLLDGETAEQHLTYAELDQQACAIAAELQRLRAYAARALLLYPHG